MEPIVAVAGQESTAVKRKMSDTHDEQSQNTDEETVETPSTEPHTTFIDSGITKNVPSKSAQETLKKIGLLQRRINVLTEARNTGIAKPCSRRNKKATQRVERRREMFKEKKRLLSVQKNFEPKKNWRKLNVRETILLQHNLELALDSPFS